MSFSFITSLVLLMSQGFVSKKLLPSSYEIAYLVKKSSSGENVNKLSKFLLDKDQKDSLLDSSLLYEIVNKDKNYFQIVEVSKKNYELVNNKQKAKKKSKSKSSSKKLYLSFENWKKSSSFTSSYSPSWYAIKYLKKPEVGETFDGLAKIWKDRDYNSWFSKAQNLAQLFFEKKYYENLLLNNLNKKIEDLKGIIQQQSFQEGWEKEKSKVEENSEEWKKFDEYSRNAQKIVAFLKQDIKKAEYYNNLSQQIVLMKHLDETNKIIKNKAFMLNSFLLGALRIYSNKIKSMWDEMKRLEDTRNSHARKANEIVKNLEKTLGKKQLKDKDLTPEYRLKLKEVEKLDKEIRKYDKQINDERDKNSFNFKNIWSSFINWVKSNNFDTETNFSEISKIEKLTDFYKKVAKDSFYYEKFLDYLNINTTFEVFDITNLQEKKDRIIAYKTTFTFKSQAPTFNAKSIKMDVRNTFFKDKAIKSIDELSISYEKVSSRFKILYGKEKKEIYLNLNLNEIKKYDNESHLSHFKKPIKDLLIEETPLSNEFTNVYQVFGNLAQDIQEQINQDNSQLKQAVRDWYINNKKEILQLNYLEYTNS